eukprot:Amastigsp_a343381_13.p1 type:complete len:402 gc:universal Amastigsp_a343381_13:83-1288(+)
MSRPERARSRAPSQVALEAIETDEVADTVATDAVAPQQPVVRAVAASQAGIESPVSAIFSRVGDGADRGLAGGPHEASDGEGIPGSPCADEKPAVQIIDGQDANEDDDADAVQPIDPRRKRFNYDQEGVTGALVRRFAKRQNDIPNQEFLEAFQKTAGRMVKGSSQLEALSALTAEELNRKAEDLVKKQTDREGTSKRKQVLRSHSGDTGDTYGDDDYEDRLIDAILLTNNKPADSIFDVETGDIDRFIRESMACTPTPTEARAPIRMKRKREDLDDANRDDAENGRASNISSNLAEDTPTPASNSSVIMRQATPSTVRSDQPLSSSSAMLLTEDDALAQIIVESKSRAKATEEFRAKWQKAAEKFLAVAEDNRESLRSLADAANRMVSLLAQLLPPPSGR